MLAVVVVVLVSLTAIGAFGITMAQVGIRNGDRIGDATIAATLASSGQPDEPRPVVLVTVRNPADAPLLAGFRARRRRVPDWLAAGKTVRVPRRTAGRRLRAAAYDVVGVVPAGGDAEFAVPVTAGRASGVGGRYLLTAVLGQTGGRLRVLRLPVTGGYSPGSGGVTLARPSHPYLDDGRRS